MRRNANQKLAADDAPGLVNRQVLLPEVNAIRLDQTGKIRAIVDDQESAPGRRSRAEFPSKYECVAVVEILLSHLDDVDTSVERRLQDGVLVAPDQRPGPEEAEPSMLQQRAARACRARQMEDPFLDRVQSVAPGFDGPSPISVVCARDLLERSQGLLGSLEISNRDSIESRRRR
jgi:hypothetical protein